MVYKGTEEVPWVRDYLDKNVEHIRKKYLGFNPERLTVIRTTEYYASYSYGVRYDLKNFVKKLSEISTVVIIPRYGDEKERFKGINNVYILDKTVLGVEIIRAADLVVSSGGTMAREAALLGIPTFSYHFRDDILKYLMGEGYPVRYLPNFELIWKYSKEVIKDPEKYRMDTSDRLKQYDNHIDIIVEEINRLI